MTRRDWRWRDAVGIAVPSVSLVTSLAVVLASIAGVGVPQIQLEVAAVVMTLSAWALISELFPS
jgi:hypothetical protein